VRLALCSPSPQGSNHPNVCRRGTDKESNGAYLQKEILAMKRKDIMVDNVDES
jgi:hypothetical protein